jgi:hypothetical protein
MVFFTGLLNSISEIGFPDWRSQLVLSKKALPKQKSHPQRWLRFEFWLKLWSLRNTWSAGALACGRYTYTYVEGIENDRS